MRFQWDLFFLLQSPNILYRALRKAHQSNQTFEGFPMQIIIRITNICLSQVY